jgi:CRP-like cAMP-binding protein
MKYSREELTTRLRSIPLFKNVADKPQIMNPVLDALEARQVSKGDEIIVEGTSGDEMYILLKGEIEISKFTMEREKYTVARFKDSMNIFFGELALVDDDKRSATVQALTDCELLVMTRAKFQELGRTHHELGWLLSLEIANLLSKRLRKANDDAVVLFEALLNELAS